MIVSEARLSANRANALKSCGPKTVEGKERSRLNAYKHGMAGEGIALPSEDEAEVSRLFEQLRKELAPVGDVANGLVRRAALMLIRLDRSAVQEAAHLSDKIGSAGSDFDEARADEVDRLMERIDEEPAVSVRKLRRMPEGVDRMIETWLNLKADLTCTVEDRWSPLHRRMAENLCGRRAGDFGIGRVEALARAIRGDFAHLGPEAGPKLDSPARMAMARRQMAELIDAEVGDLTRHRATLDTGAVAASRARAADLALFDASKEAQLACRYEAAAERTLHRALRELRQGPGPAPASAIPDQTSAQIAADLARAEAALMASFRTVTPTAPRAVPVSQPRRPEPARDAYRGPRDASEVFVGRT